MNDPQSLVQDRLARNSWGLLGTQGAILGLDVGGYGLRAALIDLHNQTYTCVHQELTGRSAEEITNEAIALARGLIQQQGVAPDHLVRIGIGFGGPVDARRGVVILAPRMPGWEQYPLKERIEQAFDVVTLVDNDANLIALAEATFGVGRDVQHLFYLHLSSGVGGGLVLDGRLYHGANTMAGEIGHAVVGPWALKGEQEHPRTLEQYLSLQGLLRRSNELGFATDRIADIFSNHAIGRQVVEEAVDILATRLSQIIALIDPQMIVVGGIVVRTGGERFIDAIQERMRNYRPLIDRSVPIVPSVLGFESIAIGGLALALESIRD